MQSGQLTGDPVVDAATRLQSQLSQLVAGLGPAVLAVGAGTLLTVVAVLAITGRRRGVPQP